MKILLQKTLVDTRSKLFLFGMVLLSVLLMPFSSWANNKPAHVNQSSVFIDKDVAAFPAIQETPGVFQLISHGRSGELLINGEWKNARQIAEWLSANGIQQSANKPTADSRQPIAQLNIYGCEFAKGAKGLEAVAYLEKTLGVTVAASNNLTGKDGDWNLEVGRAKAAISASNYNGNLQWTAADTCPTCDFDGDGIPNNVDLDDDNDGIPDILESPDCFYNLDRLSYGDRTALVTTTTQLSTTAGYPITNAVDGLPSSPTASTTTNMTQWNTATISNKDFLRFQFKYPVPLNQIDLLWYRGAPGIDFSTGVTYSIQATNDTTTAWTTLTTAATLTSNSRERDLSFSNTTDYLYYRIRVTSGSITTYELEDVMFGFSKNVMEMPISPCTDDLDGDGLPNHMDTDADGDGCVDAMEGSMNFSTSTLGAVATTSTLATYGIPTVAGYGQGLGTSQDATQVGTYCSCTNPKKIAENCDYDGDGIPNALDLDDDNDGILDTAEGLVYGYTSDFRSIGYEVFEYTGFTSCYVVPGIKNYFSRTDLYGLPWFPGSDPVATYPSPNNPIINNPTTSLWNGPSSADSHIQDIYVDFSCQTNLQVRINTNYCQKTWLYMSTSGTPYNAVVVDSVSSGTAGAGTAAFNPTGELFFRVYQFDDAQSNTYWIEYKSDQQSTWTTLDNTHPACHKQIVSATDTDGDGIPNYLDLDSDGDGCPDAIEGGAGLPWSDLVNSSLPSGNTNPPATYNGIVSYGVITNLGNTVGTTTTTNGVPTIAGTGQTIGSSENKAVLATNCVVCNAGPIAMVLSATTATNTCPATTANISGLVSSTCPTNSTLEWHTSSTPTAANLYTTPTTATAGTYYPVCHDATNSCYSPAPATGVTVTIAVCCPTAVPTLTGASMVTGSATYVGTAINQTGLGSNGGTFTITYTKSSVTTGTDPTTVGLSYPASFTAPFTLTDVIPTDAIASPQPNFIYTYGTSSGNTTGGLTAQVLNMHVDPPSGTVLAKNINWNNTALSSSWSSTYDNAFKTIYNNTVTGTVGVGPLTVPAYTANTSTTIPFNGNMVTSLQYGITAGAQSTLPSQFTYPSGNTWQHYNSGSSSSSAPITTFDKVWSFDGTQQSSIQHAPSQSSTSEIVYAVKDSPWTATGFGITNSVQPLNQVISYSAQAALSVSNTCPATTVDLTSLISSTTPSGTSLVWFTNSTATGTAYATPTQATAGTYYAFYYNSTANCYGPASAAVTVTTTICCTAGSTVPVFIKN